MARNKTQRYHSPANHCGKNPNKQKVKGGSSSTKAQYHAKLRSAYAREHRVSLRNVSNAMVGVGKARRRRRTIAFTAISGGARKFTACHHARNQIAHASRLNNSQFLSQFAKCKSTTLSGDKFALIPIRPVQLTESLSG